MNHQTNLQNLEIVATALADLKEKVVFVGGATVSLYASDPAVAEPRPTNDVDVVVELLNYSNYSNLEEQLRLRGFSHDHTSSVICRYIYQGITVDIMPTDPGILGFSNIWYPEGVQQAVQYLLPDSQQIYIFSSPYFLASKFEAFKSGRHGQDPRINSDFEDIIYLFDSRAELTDEIVSSLDSVRAYLVNEMNSLLNDQHIEENISANLPRLQRQERTQRILDIWEDLLTALK